MKNARKIARNFFSLTAASIANRFFGIITVIYLAKVLGPSDFGNINFAMAVISYFALLSHFGLDTIGVRRITQEKNREKTINSVLSAKIIFGILSFSLLGAALFFWDRPPLVKKLILFYGITIFTSNVFPFNWVFQAIEKMGNIAVSYIVQGFSYFMLIILFIKGGSQILVIPFILLAAQFFAAAYLYISYKKLFPAYSFSFTLRGFSGLFRETLPLAMAGFASILVMNASITVLGFLKPASDVGQYSAAQKISQIFLDIGNAYLGAVFPAISRYMVKSPETMRKIISFTFKLLKIFAFPAAAGVMMLSKPITLLLFGAEFAPSGAALQILIIHPFFMFVCLLFFYTLISERRQKKAFFITLLHAVLTVILAFSLIPPFGFAGAAAANVIAAAIAFFFYHSATGGTTRLRILDLSLLKSAAATAVMAAALSGVGETGIFTAVPLGAAVYTAALFAMGGLRREDLAFLGEMFRLSGGNTK